MLAHATGNGSAGLALAIGVVIAGAAVPTLKNVPLGDRGRTVMGETVPLGNGTARTYLTMNGSEPVELGVAISKTAMASLPAPKMGAHGKHAPGESFFPNLLPVAQKYQVAGYYPSSYRVRFDEDSREYRIALTGFAKK